MSRKVTVDLTEYQGNWVAVKKGHLIAHDPTALGIIDRLTALGDVGRGTTIWFEARPEDVKLWSVQYPSRPGYVCPNCLFSTQQQAQWWIDSWRNSGQEVGTVWTRDGQHDPWRPVDGSEADLPEKTELDTDEVPAIVVIPGKPRYGRVSHMKPVHEPPDENCTCHHGGVEAEDHTPGNGCEHRGCTCLYWPAER